MSSIGEKSGDFREIDTIDNAVVEGKNKTQVRRLSCLAMLALLYSIFFFASLRAHV